MRGTASRDEIPIALAGMNAAIPSFSHVLTSSFLVLYQEVRFTLSTDPDFGEYYNLRLFILLRNTWVVPNNMLVGEKHEKATLNNSQGALVLTFLDYSFTGHSERAVNDDKR